MFPSKRDRRWRNIKDRKRNIIRTAAEDVGRGLYLKVSRFCDMKTKLDTLIVIFIFFLVF